MQVRRLADWAVITLAVTLGMSACGKSGGSDSGGANPNGVVSIGIAEPKHLIPSIFFFSSRRRHTRSLCDWSSDVCYSDLREPSPEELAQLTGLSVDVVQSLAALN